MLRRRVSVFVPAYNEVAGLEPTVRGVLAAIDGELEDGEVIIVNDGSRDGTGELADRLGREDSRIRVIHNPRNLGLSAGYERALAHATMDYFTFVPGDNEMSPQSVRNILAMVGRADIIIPYHQNAWDRPLFRRLMTFVSTTMLNVLLGNRIKYYQGPNVYPTPLARALPRTTGGFFGLAEMTAHALKLGYSVVHVGLIHQERGHGRSKAVSVRNILRALSTILKLWWTLRVKGDVVSLPTGVPPPRARTRRSLEEVAA